MAILAHIKIMKYGSGMIMPLVESNAIAIFEEGISSLDSGAEVASYSSLTPLSYLCILHTFSIFNNLKIFNSLLFIVFFVIIKRNIYL